MMSPDYLPNPHYIQESQYRFHLSETPLQTNQLYNLLLLTSWHDSISGMRRQTASPSNLWPPLLSPTVQQTKSRNDDVH